MHFKFVTIVKHVLCPAKIQLVTCFMYQLDSFQTRRLIRISCKYLLIDVQKSLTTD